MAQVRQVSYRFNFSSFTNAFFYFSIVSSMGKRIQALIQFANDEILCADANWFEMRKWKKTKWKGYA